MKLRSFFCSERSEESLLKYVRSFLATDDCRLMTILIARMLSPPPLLSSQSHPALPAA